MNKLFPILDLDEEKTIVAARNSIFMDPQALGKMMELLMTKSGEGESLQKQRARELLKVFLIRGFYNTLETLKGEFLDKLANLGLLEQFFSYFVGQANQPSLPLAELVSSTMIEMQADLNRDIAMSYSEFSLGVRLSKDRKINVELPASGQVILVTVEGEEN